MATPLSGTAAMMAARALYREADECIKAARGIEGEYPIAGQNQRTLAEWYIQVAAALDGLDRDGTEITRRTA